MYSLLPLLLRFFSIPEVMDNGKLPWLQAWLCGLPHFIVGSFSDPYLLRWHITPRNPIFNIYLHKFMRDDDDRALHDHPWWFVSLIVKGNYWENLENKILHRKRWSIARRSATARHRVYLNRDSHGCPAPCWTIVVTGRTVREWGFWCNERFVHWKTFCANTKSSSEIGRGCD